MDQLTSTHIAAWLACAAFVLMAANSAAKFMDRFRETPPPLQTYATKSELAELRAAVTSLQATRDSARADVSSSVNALRLETKADIQGIYAELKAVRDSVSQIVGEVKHINTSLIGLDQKIQDLP